LNSEYRWLTPSSIEFLTDGYLLPDQSVDERFDIICNAAEDILDKPGFAKKFKENVKKGWYTLATPILSNFGTNRGLPISCFSSYIADSIESILHTQAEVGTMSKHGGGTSAYFGNLRGRGAPITNNGESAGAVHFMQLFDGVMNVVSQGRTRRGSFAAYLDLEHPDAEEFLTIRSESSPMQEMYFGVCVSDEFMESMLDGDMKKRELWATVLRVRANTGFPYIIYTGNVNNGTVDVYKEKSMWINASNLCTEVLLATNETESFVCDLSSMSILYYDEWKDTVAVELLVYFLDAVMTEFIRKAKGIKFMERAVKFAENQRALGIGWVGWHSYLQSKSIPLESMEAKLLNTSVARTIKTKAYEASARLATEYGEPDLLRGYGRRNVTLLAIAPTKSTAFIFGQVSEGIEPIRSNYFVDDKAKGKFTLRNPQLKKVLAEKGLDNEETWISILKKGGSVAHLDCLSQHEKNVFKTFAEISQLEIIIQASQRQKYIDQSQSLNLMIHPSTAPHEVNWLVCKAWKLGVKSLYYQISVSAAQEYSRNITECVSCSG